MGPPLVSPTQKLIYHKNIPLGPYSTSQRGNALFKFQNAQNSKFPTEPFSQRTHTHTHTHEFILVPLTISFSVEEAE